jgi:hypothetical protein
MANKRQRKVAEEPSVRAFVTKMAPEPSKVPLDTNPPGIGQRKRLRRRRVLFPTPQVA